MRQRLVAALLVMLTVVGLTATPSAAQAASPPLMIAAVFDGQSNTLAPQMFSAYPAKFMQQYLSWVPYVNVAVPGTTYVQRTSTAPTRVDIYAPMASFSMLFTEGGVHDLLEGLTAPKIAERIKTYVAGRRAAGYDAVVSVTVPPSKHYTAAQDTQRRALNDLLVKDPQAYGIDIVVDLSTVPQLAKTSDPSIYYDGVHLTAYAAQLVATQYGTTLFG
jgi:hypothetical protein